MSPDKPKPRILFADDELAIRLTMKALLEMHGFEVKDVGSAKEAIKALRKSEYDLVLTDLTMETANDGERVARACRKLPYKPACAILAATHPIEDFGVPILKPVKSEDLIIRIRELLTQRRP